MTAKPQPKHAPRAPRTPFVLLVLGLLVGGMCLLLALNTASAANEVARHDLAAADQSAAAQLVELENRVQASAAPANLAAAAADLGMIPAGAPGFLEIGRHGTVRVLGKAAAASPQTVYIPHPAPTRTATKTATKTATNTKSADAAPENGKTPDKSAGKKADKSADKTPDTTAKSSSTSSPPPTPTPTPTPTPETTLPGGQR